MLPRNPPIIFRVQNAAYSGIAELINFEHATTSTNQKKTAQRSTGSLPGDFAKNQNQNRDKRDIYPQ